MSPREKCGGVFEQVQIRNISQRREAGQLRATAAVSFEDGATAARQIHVVVDGEPALTEEQVCNGFALLCIVFAWEAGEARLAVDGPVDPWLRLGLTTAQSYLNAWFHRNHVVALEAEDSPAGPRGGSAPAPGAAQFFSGGLDSLFTLFHLNETLPPYHPLRISYCIHGLGVDLAETPGDEATTTLHRLQTEAARKVVPALGAELVQVRTNARTLNPSANLYAEKLHAALLAGLAQFLGSDFSDCFLSSTSDIATLRPWGSHPLLDAHYSTSTLRIRHYGERYSRLEKLAGISARPDLTANLRVCSKQHQTHPDFLNCGRCRKCVLGWLGYLALGIDTTHTFPGKLPLPEEVRSAIAPIANRFNERQAAELIAPLKSLGHPALATVLQEEVVKAQRYLDWLDGRTLGAQVKRKLARVQQRLRLGGT